MKASKQKKRHHSPAVAAQPKPALERPSSRGVEIPPVVRSSLLAFAFFVVYGLCLWRWIDVSLIYHGSGLVQDFPSFYWGWNFTQDFRTHPGGLVEYGSALLAQSLYSSWFGALVLTLQSVLVYVGTRGCLRTLGAGYSRLAALVPPLLLLAIYSKYRHYSSAVTSFNVGILIAWGWLRLSSAKTWWRLGAALILAGCLYAAAPSALIFFVPVVLVGGFRSGMGWLELLGWLGITALVPWLEGAVLFGFAPGEAYAKVLPLAWDPVILKLVGISFLIALYCFPALFCAGASLWHLKRGSRSQRAPENASFKSPDTQERNPARVAGGNLWKWETAGVAMAPLFIVYLTLNPHVRALMKVDNFAWQGRWSEVLTAAKANPKNVFVTCAAAQASYHTGMLTQQLPDLVSPADLLLFNDKYQSHWKKSDLYYDLGYLNMALHHLTESMEFYGERPALLRRLALVNLALTNLSTAQVYLGTLARAPFQSAWAKDYLELMKLDPALGRDEEVGRLRRLMVKRDSVVVLTPDEELLMLLNANRRNRMAFEYLMTYYLMTKNLDAFVKQLPRIRDFPGFAVSPLWDEGLVLATRLSGRSVQVPGHVISNEATTRVETVTRLLQQYKDNPELARSKLSAEYGHTYTFYFLFHE